MNTPCIIFHSALHMVMTHIHTQVSVYYPELAELVLVILKSALCSTTDFMQCSGMCIDNDTQYKSCGPDVLSGHK